MIFNTTNSTYEINEEHKAFRKLSGDGLWHSYIGVSNVVIGQSVNILLDQFDHAGDAITMTTSAVVSVSEGVN